MHNMRGRVMFRVNLVYGSGRRRSSLGRSSSTLPCNASFLLDIIGYRRADAALRTASTSSPSFDGAASLP
jgi:hypothetical protein